jgi:hypothetical protein
VVNAETIARLLGGARRSGNSWLCCCPAHNDVRASLSIKNVADDRLLVHCFAGCSQVSVIEALHRLGAWHSHTQQAPVPSKADRHQERARKREETRRKVFETRIWKRAWAGALPPQDSPIARWLEVRGIDASALNLQRLPLRWAPNCPLGKVTAPAMVALMSHPSTAEPIGILRTFLLSDGSGKAPIEHARMMLGKAGIIRLYPDEDVTLGLGICEGIETGLSIAAAGWRPIWAAGSLSMLARFPVLSGIECLTIFSDAKAHEVDGARACADRWAAAGREAVVWIPSAEGDWNFTLGKGA